MPERITVPLTDLTPDYPRIVDREAVAAGISPDLARRVAGVESAWNPTAKSPKGAFGIMQLMPGTAAEMGVDPTDPVQNIRGGVRYLKQQLDAHRGDETLALAAYNAGPGAVKKAGGVPPFKETRDYLRKVQGAQRPSEAAGGRLTVPLSEVQKVQAPLAALQAPEEAEGARLVAGYKGYRPPPPKPGAPPPPSSFERTSAQSAVEGLRRYSVLPMIGSMAGGTAGAAIGGPSVVGVPVTAAAGAGVGAGLGETAQVGLERAVGLHTGPPVPRILKETALGPVGEVGGRLAFKGIEKVAAPFAKRVTVEGLEAMRQLKGKVLPAQVTTSRPLDIMQNIAESSILGGGKIKAFKKAQDQLVTDLVDREIAKYGGRTAGETAGDAFVKGLTGQIDAFHQHASQLYGQLDQVAQGVQVPTASLKAWAADELERRQLVPALSGDSSLSILKQIVGLPDAVPFSQAQVVRSQALAKGRSLLDPDRDVLRGITAQITKEVDTAMETAARTAGPQVESAFRTANAFYKAGKDKFETDFLRGLIEKDADAVAKSLMRNNSPVLIREARNAVPARVWKPVQAAMATQLVEKATNVETGAISGRALLTQIKLLGASTKELFPTTADEVKRLARVLSTVQQTQGEGTGRMYVQLAQASAGVGVLTGAAIGSPQTAATSGVILLGPVALARIMASPTGIRWLTTGIETGWKTEAGTRAAANLVTFLSAGEADRSEPPPAPRTVRTGTSTGTVQPPPRPSSLR